MQPCHFGNQHQTIGPHMIRIEIIGQGGENLLSGTFMERLRKLGLPAVGLVGGMVLSFFLGSSLVSDRTPSPVTASLDAANGAEGAGVGYPLPDKGEAGQKSAAVVAESGQGINPRSDIQSGGKTAPSQGSQGGKKSTIVNSPGDVVRTAAMELHSRDKSLKTPYPKEEDTGVNSLTQELDPLLAERIRESKDWLAANDGDKAFSIQLMSVHRLSLGGLNDYLAKAGVGLSPDKIFAFPAAKGRLLLFYGRYASYDEAVAAISSLPTSIRNTGPYVLSGKNISGKLARLNMGPGKQVGVVAALKP